MPDNNSLLNQLLESAENFTGKQAAETLGILVSQAAEHRATDIHVEPHERMVLVRYRIDGDLRAVHKLPEAVLSVLITELKKLAGLDPHETSAPQEGDYNFKAGDNELEVRLSTMPVYGGEKAVLHLNVQSTKPESLENLGFWGDGLMTLKAMLVSPSGLVVVAGPRHSGLSTTLFGLVAQLNRPVVSIATVEARPKYRLPGVNHTYTSKGGLLTVAALRATLKQDPNIIMLDDISDVATAKESVQAAAKGHLILAGLRADNSLTAILRLRAAGVEPYALAAAWRAGVGQCLVRRLCPNCRERYQLDADEQRSIEASFGLDQASKRRRLHELEQAALNAGIGAGQQLGTTPSHITHLWRPKARGCSHCDHSGYQGRLAIVEVVAPTDELQKALTSQELLSASTLQAILVKKGFVPMALDGLIKALRGQTTALDVIQAVS